MAKGAELFPIAHGMVQSSKPLVESSSRKEENVADLKIRVFKGGETDPKKTITIPGGVLRIASKLIPKKAVNALQEKGIDIAEIVRLSDDPAARGILVKVEEHDEDETLEIALE
jgi:hypothetical protein